MLGSAFEQELLHFGFDASVNPFVHFLKLLKANKGPTENPGTVDPLILKRLNDSRINSRHYAALHNAYIRGDITSQNLRGKSNLGASDLIWQPILYLQSPTDMMQYLRIQRIISQFSPDTNTADLTRLTKDERETLLTGNVEKILRMIVYET